jgi:hypothetical protein
MSVVRKFVIYGPVDTLKRLNQTVIEGTSPTYHFISDRNSGNGHYVDVCVYEEHQKLLNSSISVTLVMEFSGKSVAVEAISTGGRMGFRGSLPSDDQSIFDTVTDFVIDYSKRFGLTMQETAVKSLQPES